MAGQCLTHMLRRNTSLSQLKLEACCCRALTDALDGNASLQFLSFECNPLTGDNKDFSGVVVLDHAREQHQLRTLNLWRRRSGAKVASSRRSCGP